MRTKYEASGNAGDEHAQDDRGRCAKLDKRDAHKQADDVGDEPGDPHGGTQAVKRLLTLEGTGVMASALHVDDRCPDGMEEHEDDGGESGYAVDGGRSGGAFARNDAHERGAGGVARKAAPEEGEVDPAQATVSTLLEHADGIQDESASDGKAGEHEHGGHESSFQAASL